VFRFGLENAARVTLAVEAHAAATETSVGGLLPAFSIYGGLAHLPPAGPDYDTTDATLAWLATLPEPAKEGAWNALDDFRIGNEDGDLSLFTFAGYGADGDAANFGATPGIVGDGLADGFVAQSFFLEAGDYTIFIGGADYAAQEGSEPHPSYGIAATLTVPEPGAALAGLAAFVALGLAARLARRVQTDDSNPEARACITPSGPWEARCGASSHRSAPTTTSISPTR